MAYAPGLPPKFSMTPPKRQENVFHDEHSRLKGRDFFFLLIPALSFIEVRLVGRLFLTELIALVSLVFLFVTNRSGVLKTAWAKRLLLFGGLWFSSQVVTDMIRSTAFRDWSRGWSKILFFFVAFLALSLWLKNSRKRFVLCAIGISLANIASVFLNPSDFQKEDAWKFGGGFALTVLVASLSTTRQFTQRKYLAPLLMFAVTVMHFVLGSRSMGGIAFLTAIYLLLQYLATIKNQPPRVPTILQQIAFAIALGIGTQVLLGLYGYAAEGGMLGRYAQAKYFMQTARGRNVITGGRDEFIVSTRAVAASPIIGYGSWAKSIRYAKMKFFMHLPHNQNTELMWKMRNKKLEDVIPSHSYVMGAWVEAGILGALFWLVILLVVARVLSRLYAVPDPLSPLIVFLSINLLWSTLFSPFGANERITVAFELALMLLALRRMEQRFAQAAVPSVSTEPPQRVRRRKTIEATPSEGY